MAEIGLLQEAGAVAFTDGAQSVANAQVMRRALTYARDVGRAHHAITSRIPTSSARAS